jgi:hypothetical protein
MYKPDYTPPLAVTLDVSMVVVMLVNITNPLEG